MSENKFIKPTSINIPNFQTCVQVVPSLRSWNKQIGIRGKMRKTIQNKWIE